MSSEFYVSCTELSYGEQFTTVEKAIETARADAIDSSAPHYVYKVTLVGVARPTTTFTTTDLVVIPADTSEDF